MNAHQKNQHSPDLTRGKRKTWRWPPKNLSNFGFHILGHTVCSKQRSNMVKEIPKPMASLLFVSSSWPPDNDKGIQTVRKLAMETNNYWTPKNRWNMKVWLPRPWKMMGYNKGYNYNPSNWRVPVGCHDKLRIRDLPTFSIKDLGKIWASATGQETLVSGSVFALGGPSN